MTTTVASLAERMRPVLARYGVRRGGVFGSYARGDATSGSDVDVLVEFPPGSSLLDLVGLQLDLGKALGLEVDANTYRAIHPGSWPRHRMPFEPLDYLRHILVEVDYILATVSGLTFDSFSRDQTLRRTFVRSLEFICEATKKVPDDFRAEFPDVEWRAIGWHV